MRRGGRDRVADWACAATLGHAALLGAGLAWLAPIALPAPAEPLAVELAELAVVPAPLAAAAPEPEPPTPVPVAAPVPLPAPPKISVAARPPPRRVAQPAPPAAPAPPAPEPGPAPVDPAWRNEFALWLAQHRTYPDAARRDGTEGRATIRVVIAQDGSVLTAEMLSGTGSAVLDRAVGALLDTVRTTRFPFAPGMTQPRITQTVTLRYALTQ
jgi:protein TonB